MNDEKTLLLGRRQQTFLNDMCYMVETVMMRKPEPSVNSVAKGKITFEN